MTPQFITGNLWAAQADIIAVTTNAMVKRSGELVMGRGAALEAAERMPGLPSMAGGWIKAHCGSCGFYGWLMFRNIGLFQVKYSWQEAASLELIERSVQELTDWLTAHPGVTVAMNYPGIGNGRLTEAAVAPLLAGLPEQVTIYRREEG